MSPPPKSRFLVPAQRGAMPLAPLGGLEESGVRVRSHEDRAFEASQVLAQLEAEHGALMRGLEALRFLLARRVAGREPVAFRPLRGRAQALAGVRDGVAQLLGVAVSLEALLMPESALVEYLRGILAWAHATLEALRDLAQGIAEESPDFGWYKLRLELAENLHFVELEAQVQAELSAQRAHGLQAEDPTVEAVRASAERLFHVARELEDLL